MFSARIACNSTFPSTKSSKCITTCIEDTDMPSSTAVTSVEETSMPSTSMPSTSMPSTTSETTTVETTAVTSMEDTSTPTTNAKTTISSMTVESKKRTVTTELPTSTKGGTNHVANHTANPIFKVNTINAPSPSSKSLIIVSCVLLCGILISSGFIAYLVFRRRCRNTRTHNINETVSLKGV